MNKDILRLSLPNIITNITVPLLGMVDLAIVGHIGNETYIGAIAIGTMIFNMIYWNFGFLRAGTSGFTAQAYGAEDMREAVHTLIRAITLALFIAALLLLLQYPMAQFSRFIVRGSDRMVALALRYFYVRIWAAPATLLLYSIKGWYIGMQNARLPMWIAIAMNLFNIAASLLFVFVWNMGIEGVALGTVLAQYGGLAVAVAFLVVKYRHLRVYVDVRDSLRWNEMRRFGGVNSDIFLRTLCLVLVFTFIPAVSSHMGDRILAANTLLMQLFTICSYFLDGFAYAGESLVGRFIGARDRNSLVRCVRYLMYWGVGLTIVFTMTYALFGRNILQLLTNDTEVVNTAMQFIVWSVLVPVCGFAAFIFDGVYIGAAASKSMRNAIFIATAAFFAIYYGLLPLLGNNALWIALLTFLLLRGVIMGVTLRKDIYELVVK